MANPATNKTSEDTRLVNQGARPTDITENQRINVRVDSASGDTTGESRPTHNSENSRIETVVYP